MTPLSIGVVGTGDIAPAYLNGILASDRLQLYGCAGRDPARTAALAGRFATRALTLAEIVAAPDVAIIVNLTSPNDHAAVTRAALAAGKHVYSEKPLGTDPAEADALLALATDMGLVLACAPATPLGPTQQVARRLVAEGAIGTIVGAATAMVYPGPQLFHPHPEALFAPGAGPLFDMGVYDIAALCHLLGPVERVSAIGRRLADTREALVGPGAGTSFPVLVDTHIVAILRFASGPLATMTLSFDGFASAAPGLEIIGTSGMIRLARSSMFDGEVSISTERGEWRPIAVDSFGWSDDLWIIGLIDLAQAIEQRRAPRCSMNAARHHLAVLHAIDQSVQSESSVSVPASAEWTPAEPLDDYEALRAAPWSRNC